VALEVARRLEASAAVHQEEDHLVRHQEEEVEAVGRNRRHCDQAQDRLGLSESLHQAY
jgi:hypothetical protein